MWIFYLNSSFFAVSFLLHITTKALYLSNYVICYRIGLSSGLSCSMKQTTTKSLTCVTNKCNSYTQQMLSFSFLQYIILLPNCHRCFFHRNCIINTCADLSYSLPQENRGCPLKSVSFILTDVSELMVNGKRMVE